MYKLFLPYDVFERHKKVGSMIDSDQTVVDIGGELNHLSQFCSPKKIIVANLSSGDIIISEDKLPFKRKSFDVVCAIDVIEHIPKKNRKIFLENLLEIASQKVILSFPIGTKRHIAYEKEIQTWLMKKGEKVDYLEEHIKFSLPKKREIETALESENSKLTYAGNISINRILFKIYMFDPRVKFFRKIIYSLKKIFNFLTNGILYLILIDKDYSESVNRAYVIIKTIR
ncbi:hypothetical protein A3A54_00920 [Candidatus Curtissbacteria bacterium RIFCSPLOWO2_01_FULL_39_62]|uniref:Methyltransferase type 11 domain-containing protein n=1 Tax=Candidatus Curtissbacteria bacterium RIFCSPLOWO2_12_FULL_38_9 TaxID=1797735 RepID=A0A1F5I7D5_9BACT|nr:MAG: hypothetical protein A3E11_01865 [Candidatus Curtissbacteria bacterium RIFCSPHIGHO2_12_FULL_38_37]OGE01848.1 MAG: hypothetical protein A3A54_00920 [Candidatus Curtissbacteria bacterium RIFCSPLOWO2_01_FULL_39_62]OGE12307.1 MAG: hypothetical protein A3G14_03580 [Candidatus Curtissbacteria bacterium RIFCSPLOWO2_12_FULL_38_9]